MPAGQEQFDGRLRRYGRHDHGAVVQLDRATDFQFKKGPIGSIDATSCVSIYCVDISERRRPSRFSISSLASGPSCCILDRIPDHHSRRAKRPYFVATTMPHALIFVPVSLGSIADLWAPRWLERKLDGGRNTGIMNTRIFKSGVIRCLPDLRRCVRDRSTST